MGSGITVTRTSDTLAAFVMVASVRETSYPSAEEILNELINHGIVYGIDTKAIDEMSMMRIVEKQMKVASGTQAMPGTDGRLEMLIDTDSVGKPRQLEDGSVDHHDISFVLNVSKGDAIARHVLPVAGQEGETVTGKPIMPPVPHDVQLLIGPGTMVSPLDPNLVIAGIDGGVWIDERGVIEVHSEKKIAGDIDYQTGDIFFPGDLTIAGTVRSGFSVETKGSLVINGSVEDCRIKCRGNLVIKGGAFGSGSGSIECQGSIQVRHLENFSVMAHGEIIVSEEILHGTVTAGKMVFAKAILGGTIASITGIEAETVGSQAEIKTVLDIGRKYALLQLRYRLLQKLSKLTTEVGNDKLAVFQFVRNNLDENGTMSYDNEKKFDEMKTKSMLLHNAFSDVQAEIDKLECLKVDGSVSYIKARKMFPNTLVKYGLGEQLVLEMLENVRLLPVEEGNTVTLSRENDA